jgi:hypothetical protein
MRYILRILFFGMAAVLTSHPCLGASLTLTVVQDPSSTADLSALTAGESVTFHVNLSGLDVANGQTLGTLEGTVAFDGSLLGQPSSILPGSIVPDASGFVTAANPGLADATYSSLFSNSGELITANGTLYEFTVVVQPVVAGSGVLSLDPSNGGFVAAFDASNNPVTIAFGPDLPFTVGAPAVPEPSSLVVFAAAGSIVVLARVWSAMHQRKTAPGAKGTKRL